MIPRRNSQKRFYLPGLTYFITCKTHQAYPYFEHLGLCELWVKELKLARELYKFKLYAFCLLPDHFHLIIEPGSDKNISQIMHFLKRNFSRNANEMLFHHEGDDDHRRLHDDRFVGIDRYVMDNRKIINNNLPHFQWQRSFHDHYIRSERDFQQHLPYTVYNFTKHGLLGNWHYTSLNYAEITDKF